ncbi:MAG: SdrD B-like domain-containing protein [Planctomyces sp.]
MRDRWISGPVPILAETLRSLQPLNLRPANSDEGSSTAAVSGSGIRVSYMKTGSIFGRVAPDHRRRDCIRRTHRLRMRSLSEVSEVLELRTVLNAVSVQLSPEHDATLYQSGQGNFSGGAGQLLAVGQDARSTAIRRSLISFDIAGAGIPANATILDAVLTMNVAFSAGAASLVSLHHVSSAWGEGSNDPPDNELTGLPARAFDSTWLYRFFNGSAWQTPGGDFDASASSSTFVDGTGSFEWSGGGLINDVQQWLDDPSTNSGWIFTEDSSAAGIHLFHSRESLNAVLRPVLEITYEAPLETVTIEGRKWHDRNADGLRPSLQLQNLNLEFRNSQGHFNQYRGREYWYLSSSDRSWYFLKPDGTLTRWDRTPGKLTGTLVATPGVRFYLNPKALLRPPSVTSGPSSPSEPYLNGVQIELLNEFGQVIATTVTQDLDRNRDDVIDPEFEKGWYQFSDLPAGKYQVREIVPAGWKQSASVRSEESNLARQLRDDLGLNFAGSWYENWGKKGERWLRASSGWVYVTPAGALYRWDGKPITASAPLTGTWIASLSRSYFVDPSLLIYAAGTDLNVSSGETVHGGDFGNYQPTKVRGRTFRDTNGNGNYDPAGLGTLVPSSVLPSGIPSGNYQWFQQSGSGSSSTPNVWFYISNRSLYRWTPAGGSVFISSVPAGVTPSPTASPIAAFVDEVWMNGWMIELLDDRGNVIATQSTRDIDLNGNRVIEPDSERGWYSFEDLPPGQYTVREVRQTGWIQTTPVASSLQASADTLRTQRGFAWGGRDSFNWGGRNERWFRGRSGERFYIIPSGQIFEWDGRSGGTRGLVNGKSIAQLSSSFYVNLNLLFASRTATVSASAESLSQNVIFGNHKVSDGFFAALSNELLTV